MRANWKSWILLLAVAAGFAYGLARLFEMRFAEGDIYPPYSSLRSDPMGAKALHDSFALLPDVSVTRNFRPLNRLACTNCTVFLFGLEPFTFERLTDDRFQELENVAKEGARVVIAMRPVRRVTPPKPSAVPAKKDPPTIEKRWGVAFGYIATRNTRRRHYFLSKPDRSRYAENERVIRQSLTIS